jgi:hypothetical protein
MIIHHVHQSKVFTDAIIEIIQHFLCKILILGLYCSKTGLYAGYCICANNYYFNTSSQQCSAQKLNGIYCSNSIECREDLGLYCSSTNMCECSSGYHWLSSSSCRLYIFSNFDC